MRRHLLTAASIVGLIVCLAAAGLWYVIRARNEAIFLRKLDRDTGRRDWGCWVNGRGVLVTFFRPVVPQPIVGHYDNRTNTALGFNYSKLEADAHTTKLKLWGIEVSRNVPYLIIGLEDITLQGHATQVTFPWWLVFAAAATLPLWRALTFCRLFQQRRRERGLCVRCGYDLRGSKEAGRCPECGTPFQPGIIVKIRRLLRAALPTTRPPHSHNPLPA